MEPRNGIMNSMCVCPYDGCAGVTRGTRQQQQQQQVFLLYGIELVTTEKQVGEDETR